MHRADRVEAISNGVPAFRKPKSRNAALTLTLMGGLAITLFGGITILAVALNARANPDGNPSVISQLATSVFGGGTALFYLFQAATAGILILAALRFKTRLLFTPGVVAISVPYHLGVASQGWLGGNASGSTAQPATIEKLPVGASHGPGSAGR